MKAKSSWKQKIDPAFSQIIREYLKSLYEIQLPSNSGYIVMEPKDRTFTDVELERFKIMAPLYEKDNTKDILSMSKFLFGINLSKGNIKKLHKEINSPLSFIYMLVSFSEFCEKDSRNYYLNSFGFFSSKENMEKILSGLDDKDKIKLGQRLLSDFVGLFWHIALIGGTEFADTNFERAEFVRKYFDHRRYFRNIFFFVNDTIALIINKKSIRMLYDEAKNGNDKSLYKLIKIDKTLFDHEWLRVRIRKAMYSGDGKFFRDLADAIKADPLDTRCDNLDISLVLLQFWNAGLYRLTVPELMSLLKHSGMSFMQDEIAFRKIKDRIRPFLPVPDSIFKIKT